MRGSQANDGHQQIQDGLLLNGFLVCTGFAVQRGRRMAGGFFYQPANDSPMPLYDTLVDSSHQFKFFKGDGLLACQVKQRVIFDYPAARQILAVGGLLAPRRQCLDNRKRFVFQLIGPANPLPSGLRRVLVVGGFEQFLEIIN